MSSQGKILIIDDERVVLNSCTDILAGSSYQIATAHNGTQGLNLLEEFQPDLVFVDLKMPGIQGLEVIERIQLFDPTIVTIVITGFATVGSAVDAMKLGAYDFLPKPFTPAEFRLITARGLEKRRLLLETISLRKEKELLRQNFAAIVSHELKSPLGAVQQNMFVLQRALKTLLNSEQDEMIERMKIRIAELITLINTWLRAISTDIESIREDFIPTNLEPVITSAIESVETQAIRKDIQIARSIPSPLGSISGDRGTLIEVFVNIIGNAIKYSYQGSSVKIEASNLGEQIEISVADAGVGISDEELPFIFGDFYRGKSGEAEQGYGLGLALSRRIVELHGGTITVTSMLGEGSKFTVSLPTCEIEDASDTNFHSEISLSPEQGVLQ